MKSIRFAGRLSMVVAAVAVLSACAVAQPVAGGRGAHWSAGYAMGCGPAPAAGCGMGYGAGAGHHSGPAWRGGGPGGAGGSAGPGGAGALLSAEEMAAHRERMHSLSTYDECKAVMAEHRELLEKRAQEQAVTPPRGPNPQACDRMRERGWIK